MRLAIIGFAAIGAMALAAPASAQMVNGLSGPNYMHDAPIGTKAGGAPSTLNVPGEKEAIAGAIRNEMDAKNMGPVSGPVAMKTRVSVAASLNKRAALRRPVARIDLDSSKSRLERSSD